MYRSWAGLQSYLADKRAELETSGVAGQLSESISKVLHEKFPNEDEERHQAEVGMILDVMALDEERYDYYASRYNIENAAELKEEFFNKHKTIDRELARAAWNYKDQATVQRPEGGVHYTAYIGDRLLGVADSKMVGNNYNDAAQELLDKYGTNFRISTQVNDAMLHKDLSQLLNVAEAEPAVAAILRETEFVSYRSKQPGSTALAHVGAEPGSGITINVPRDREYWGVGPSVWVHELGHIADNHRSFEDINTSFNRGRQVSSYAWESPLESFAESWVAAIGGDAYYREQVPEKMAYMDELIEELSQ
jgi:hypothetical protein